MPHLALGLLIMLVGALVMALGLYISRGMVEGMHGRIWVDSAPGQGSAFNVALPLARGEGLGVRSTRFLIPHPSVANTVRTRRAASTSRSQWTRPLRYRRT